MLLENLTFISSDTINKIIDGVESRLKVSFLRHFIFPIKMVGKKTCSAQKNLAWLMVKDFPGDRMSDMLHSN